MILKRTVKIISSNSKVTIPKSVWKTAKLYEITSFVCSLDAETHRLIYHPTDQVGKFFINNYRPQKSTKTSSQAISVPGIFVNSLPDPSGYLLMSVDTDSQSITLEVIK